MHELLEIMPKILSYFKPAFENCYLNTRKKDNLIHMYELALDLLDSCSEELVIQTQYAVSR